MDKQQIQPPNPIVPTIPVGTILAFIGNTSDIPSGWILCNNTGIKSIPQKDYKGPTIPDLDGITLIGQGSNYAIGKTGGEATHQLSIEEIPSHSHTINDGNFGTLGTALETGDSGYIPYCKNDVFGNNGTDAIGGGKPHNNMQPYHVVYYIMYIGIATANGKYKPLS